MTDTSPATARCRWCKRRMNGASCTVGVRIINGTVLARKPHELVVPGQPEQCNDCNVMPGDLHHYLCKLDICPVDNCPSPSRQAAFCEHQRLGWPHEGTYELTVAVCDAFDEAPAGARPMFETYPRPVGLVEHPLVQEFLSDHADDGTTTAYLVGVDTDLPEDCSSLTITLPVTDDQDAALEAWINRSARHCPHC